MSVEAQAPFPSVDDATFAPLVLQADRPTLVDCWTPSCVVCRKLEPILVKFARATSDRVAIYRLNPLENPAVASTYAVQSAPTLLLFHHGTLQGRKTGFVLPAALHAWLAPVLDLRGRGRNAPWN